MVKKQDPPGVFWQPGEIRLHDWRIFAKSGSDTVLEFLARAFTLAEVSNIEVDHRLATATLRFPPEMRTSEVLRQLTAALSGPEPAAPSLRQLFGRRTDRCVVTTNVFRVDGSYLLIPTVSGVQRVAYLALASGSFGMSILGAVIPGIPTVPFVILTSYFLVRSSPSWNQRLLRSRLFGPMLRDWQLHGAVRYQVKWLSIGFTVIVLLISLMVVEVSGILLGLVLLMAATGIYIILSLPTLPETQAGEATANVLAPAPAR